MRRLDWIRVAILAAAVGIAGFAFAARGMVFINETIAQTLIGTFSVLAGFLVSALAFIQPVQSSTTLDKAFNNEVRKRTTRLSAFFYLYLINILALLAYTILKEAADRPFPQLGTLALCLSLFSLVVSLEVPRMVIKLRALQSQSAAR